jgi:hypothetical protein
MGLLLISMGWVGSPSACGEYYTVSFPQILIDIPMKIPPETFMYTWMVRGRTLAMDNY